MTTPAKQTFDAQVSKLMLTLTDNGKLDTPAKLHANGKKLATDALRATFPFITTALTLAHKRMYPDTADSLISALAHGAYFLQELMLWRGQLDPLRTLQGMFHLEGNLTAFQDGNARVEAIILLSKYFYGYLLGNMKTLDAIKLAADKPFPLMFTRGSVSNTDECNYAIQQLAMYAI
jgi:hypothetical protein